MNSKNFFAICLFLVFHFGLLRGVPTDEYNKQLERYFDENEEHEEHEEHETDEKPDNYNVPYSKNARNQGYCGDKNYKLLTQVCCCGKIYPKKANWNCCGYFLYNTKTSKCCSYFSIRPKTASCPPSKA